MLVLLYVLLGLNLVTYVVTVVTMKKYAIMYAILVVVSVAALFFRPNDPTLVVLLVLAVLMLVYHVTMLILFKRADGAPDFAEGKRSLTVLNRVYFVAGILLGAYLVGFMSARWF